MFNNDNSLILEEIESCLESINQVKKYWLNGRDKTDLDRHATMILKVDYEKSLLKSYAQPKHLIYIFKINQMLNLVIELFDSQSVKDKLKLWLNPQEHEWKLHIFKTMILMSDEIQMMLEQNLELSSLAKVRQYFELYALYHLTSKYGPHVFDFFLHHGINNMTNFIKYFTPDYDQKVDNTKIIKWSSQQIRSPYGWMQKIKQIDKEDRKIKHIIQQGIKDDEFLKHIYLHSNFPHHASSFMFATYVVKDKNQALQNHTKLMVFHTYLWLLDILVKNVRNTFKSKLKTHKNLELKKLYQIFKTIQKYVTYAKTSTSNKHKVNKKSDFLKQTEQVS